MEYSSLYEVSNIKNHKSHWRKKSSQHSWISYYKQDIMLRTIRALLYIISQFYNIDATDTYPLRETLGERDDQNRSKIIWVYYLYLTSQAKFTASSHNQTH